MYEKKKTTKEIETMTKLGTKSKMSSIVTAGLYEYKNISQRRLLLNE